ncbi:T9SS type A sorting domain-containing protein, partial [Dyadobacter psychrophilus]
CNTIKGWAWASNYPGSPVTVEVLEGASIRATVVANIFRQDLLDAGTGTGNYGFSIALPAALKTGQARQLSIRIQGTTFTLAGSPKTITCAAPPVYNGNFETADCDKISGWVWAVNYPNTDIIVEVMEGTSVIATGRANIYRGDMNIGTRNYGFRIPLPASLKTGLSRQLTVRVQGSTYILPGSSRTVTCVSPPEPYAGDFELADCNTIKGWAWASSNPSSSVTIEVLEGNTVFTTSVANIFRQDLLNAGTGTGKYGFSVALPEEFKSGQARQLSIRIQGTIFTLSGSPKTVTCAKPAIYGNFETADCSKISGWVWASNYSNSSLTVEVLEGSSIVATAQANLYRGDMSIGTRNYGFRIPLPESLKNGQPRQLSVRVKGTTYVLPGSSKTVICSSSARYAASDFGVFKSSVTANGQIDFELVLAPNPTKGLVTVNYNLLPGQNAELIVFDLKGRTVYTGIVTGIGEKKSQLVDLSSNAEGDYIFQLRASNNVQVKRVVLIK